MSLKNELLQDMKEAMKAKEAGKTALSVIRMVRSAIRNAEIDAAVIANSTMPVSVPSLPKK